jgi:putative beta-barrel porin BBP2
MTSALRVLALVSLFLSGAAGVFAQEEQDPRETARFHWGALSFTPGIVIDNVGFDNNVFNDAERPVSDTTAAVGPGINLWTKLGPIHLTERSSGQYLFFNQYENQRSWNTANELKLEWPMARLRPFAIGGYANAKQRPGFEIDARVRASTNLATLGTDLRFSGKTTLVLSGTRTTTAFDQKETFLGNDLASALNRHSDTEVLEFRYRLTPLTTFVLASDANQDRFEIDHLRNTDSFAVRPGFEFKPFALISGKVFVGFRHFNVLNEQVQDFQGAVAVVDAKYTLTTSTQLGARVSRDIAFSFDDAFPYYALTDAGLTVRQHITSSWDVDARGGVQRLAYRAARPDIITSARTDGGQSYGLGLGYLVGETLRIGFDVNYYLRRSPLTQRNYDGLRAGVSVSYGISQ